VQRIIKKTPNSHIGTANAPHFLYQRNEGAPSPLRAGRNAAPTASILYMCYVTLTASFIIQELANQLGSTDRKRKYGM
jgi:hypothetical protein